VGNNHNFICLREEKQDDKGLCYNLIVRKYLTTIPPPPQQGKDGKGTEMSLSEHVF